MRRRSILGSLGLLLLPVGASIAVLVQDDMPSEQEARKRAALQAFEARYAPHTEKASAIARKWASKHRRRDEVIPQYGCGITTDAQPFRYRCKVTYRNDAPRYRRYDVRPYLYDDRYYDRRFDLRRYRGYDLRLVEPVPGEVKLVGVRRRAGGPRAYD